MLNFWYKNSRIHRKKKARAIPTIPKQKQKKPRRVVELYMFLTILSIYACLLVKHVQLAMDESLLTLPLPFVTQFFSFISRENWNLRVFKMKSANTVRNWSIGLTRMTKKSEWFYNCFLTVGWCFCYQGVHLRKNIRAMVMLMDLFFKR